MNKYLNANIWIIFSVIAFIYAVALTIEYKFIYTVDYFVYAFGREKSTILNNYLDTTQKQAWINYLLIIPIIWFPTLTIGLCLKTGAILRNIKVSYFKLVDLVLKSHLIFSINYLIFTILKWKQIIHREHFNLDNCFDYQSVLAVIQIEKIPYWLIYSLQLVSFTELFQLLFISYGIRILFQYSFAKSVLFYLIFYGIGLFFWIVFTIYLQTFMLR